MYENLANVGAMIVALIFLALFLVKIIHRILFRHAANRLSATFHDRAMECFRGWKHVETEVKKDTMDIPNEFCTLVYTGDNAEVLACSDTREEWSWDRVFFEQTILAKTPNGRPFAVVICAELQMGYPELWVKPPRDTRWTAKMREHWTSERAAKALISWGRSDVLQKLGMRETVTAA